MRGEVNVDPRHDYIRGITPACAGRRLTFSRPDALVEDHPRVCGEKRESVASAAVTQGSPPRVRGEVAAPQLGLLGIGITPACAGRSLASSVLPVGREDHPRVCGEKQISSWVP